MKFECKYCGHGGFYLYEKRFAGGTGRHIGLCCSNPSCNRHQKWIAMPLFIQLRDEGHELYDDIRNLP